MQRAELLSVLALALCGCSNDLDDLFAGADADAGAVSADAGDASSQPPEPTDILSLYADLGAGDGCLKCLRSKCGEAERTCLDDDACVDQARCAARCRDPSCTLRCRSYSSLESVLLGESETLHACRARACVEQCAVGRVFDCVGEFEWEGQVASVSPTVIVFTVPTPSVAPPAPSEVSLRYCGGLSARCDDTPTSPLEASARETPNFGVSIVGERTLDSLLRADVGFFEVEAPGFDSHLFYPLLDWTKSAPETVLFFFPPEIYAMGFALGSVEDDPGYGFFLFNAWDCLLDPAPGIQFEVSPAPTHPDARAWYGMTPRSGLDRTVVTNGTATGGYLLLDERIYEVRAKRADTQEVVAHAPAWSRAGARTHIELVPRSRSEPP